MLKTIGVVQLDDQQNIRATSQTAKYMLHSIASYLEEDIHWIDDWHTRGTNHQNESPLFNAASLLYLLEKRRLDFLDSPAPSRSEQVAQVLIKRTNKETGKPELLFQFDENANQFQLIGGRHNDKDPDLLSTMIREIEEEVSNNLIYGQDYQLKCVISDLAPMASLSSTFGALTQYNFSIFHMQNLSELVNIQPEDEWVPIEDMLAGYVVTNNGTTIPFNTGTIFHLIDENLKGGFASLPDSFR